MLQSWTSRQFSFAYPVERIGVFLSRLRGTAARIQHVVRTLPPAARTERRDGGWSIQEHVGHLHDLEALHLARLDELDRGATTLTAADLENRSTWNARHNDQPFEVVFARFVAVRTQLITRLSALDAAGLARSALHPRLQQPMRAIDVAFFAAEHDDQHLARIEQLAATTTCPPLPANDALWDSMPHDEPMPQLERRRLIGNDAMISHVTLHRGCVVPVHAHHNEQFSCVLSGKVRFTLADGERVLGAGAVLQLPSHAPHGAEALETAVVLDIFAPPSANTGVDATRR